MLQVVPVVIHNFYTQHALHSLIRPSSARNPKFSPFEAILTTWPCQIIHTQGAHSCRKSLLKYTRGQVLRTIKLDQARKTDVHGM